MSSLTSVHARRLFVAVAVALCLVVFAARPAGAVTIGGGTVINQTWTPAGNPYVVQGDITIPAGAFLTIQAGTIVQFVSGDSQMSGRDTTRSELTVIGTLAVNGSTSNPVTFQSQSSTSRDAWYGIIVTSAAASATITGAILQHATYGLLSEAPGTVVGVTSTTATTNSIGFRIDAGTPTLDRITATGNSYGLQFNGTGGATVVNSLIYANPTTGVYDTRTSGNSALNLTNTTINANGNYGVYSATSDVSALNIKNCIVTNHGQYGLYRASTSTMFSVTYTDIWNNAVGNSFNVPLSTGTFNCNPLYVSTSNLRLTSNSPARFAGDTSGDIGALPFTGDATPGLYGTLWTSTSLAASGSPYAVPGDLTVAPGVTLTIDPGVTINFATGDNMLCGADGARAELTVAGSLVAAGTKTMPIRLTSTGAGANSWYGVNLTGPSTATLDYVTAEKGTYGVLYQSTGSASTIRRSTFQTNGNGLRVTAGTAVVDAMVATGNSYGVYVLDTGQLTLTNSVVRSNTTTGIYVVTGNPAGLTTNITNCTLNANGNYGIYAAPSTTMNLNVKNSIVTNHGQYGLYRGASAANFNVSYSDIWNNAVGNTFNIALGADSISQNPNYAGAPADLHLLSNSVCIDTATASGAPATDLDGVARPINGDLINAAEFDMGAYEFVPSSFCGDGVVVAGEVCDDGAQNGTYGHCKADCSGLGPRCGDNITNGPEECDDGNTTSTDACTNACKNAKCGDTFVRAGVEECDDGNTSNTDACTNICQNARCGDTFLQAGTEECDDGNTTNTDACTNACKNAKCGDGIVRPGAEQCDDANLSNLDACLNTCVNASCGDGFLRTGVEECDDGNLTAGDGCGATCMRENRPDAGTDGGTDAQGAGGSTGAGGTSGTGGAGGSIDASGSGGMGGNVDGGGMDVGNTGSGGSGSGADGGAGGGTGTDAAADRGSGNGADGKADGASSTDAGAGTDAAVTPPSSGSGCGCSTATDGSGAPPAALVLFGAALLVTARRRRRSGRLERR